MKERIIMNRIILYILGCLILSLGVTLTIKANLGTGTWFAMFIGLSNKTSLTIGTWSVIIYLLLVLINSLLDSKIPNFFAFATIILQGYMVDFFNLLILDDLNVESFIFQILLLILGFFLTSLGIVIYVKGELAFHPIEEFISILNSKYKMSIRKSRTLMDITTFLLALLLSGPITFATLFLVLSSGVLIQFLDERLKWLSI